MTGFSRSQVEAAWYSSALLTAWLAIVGATYLPWAQSVFASGILASVFGILFTRLVADEPAGGER